MADEKSTAKQSKAAQHKAGSRYKIRPRAGDWGFLVRGKGKPQ